MELVSSSWAENVSRTDLMRGIITETLTTAAREILAAVERLVSDYEAEASGFREEIHRQKVQLELLQPRIKEEPTDGMEINQSFGNFFNTKYPMEEESHTNCDGEERQSVTEQDYETDSRFSTPTIQTDVGEPQVRSLDGPIDLRICFLTNWKTETISKTMLKSQPFQVLQFPSGLQEAEFLNLLRSNFPLLGADGPIDFFVTNKTRKLQLLTVESMTPEQVYRAAGTSVLYLRPKPPERVQAQGDNSPASPPTRYEGSLRTRSQRGITVNENLINLEVRLLEESCSAATSPDGLEKFQLHQLKCSVGMKEEEFLKLLKSTIPQLAEGRPFTVLADQGRRKPPVEVDRLTPEDICRSCGSTTSPTIYIQLEETPPKEGTMTPENFPSTSHPTTPELENLVYLKICILDGPSTAVMPQSEFQSEQIIELQCPGDLREPEFFTLLRATFPLLEDKDFDLLTGHGSKVSPIGVKNLTPEKINHITTSAGGSVLYVRLKDQQNSQESYEEVQSRLSPKCVQESTFTSRHEEMEDNGNGGGDDSSNPSANRRTKEEANTAPVRRMEKKRVHKIRQLEGDETEDSEDSDGSDVLTRVSSLYLSAAQNPDRPKSPPPKTEEEEPVLLSDREEFDDEETEDSEDGDDTDSVSTRLSTQKPRVSDPKSAQNPEPVKVKKERTVQHVSVKTISQDTTKDDGQGSSSTKDGPSSLPPPTSGLRSGQNKPTEGEGVKNPNKETNGQAPRPSGRSCHACRLHHGSMRMLVRHAWTHINDVELLCGVCGHQSDSSHALRTHLQTHQKVFTCKICTKVFLSIKGFEEHKERHKGHTRSHRCRVCSKTFTNMSELQKHKEVHANEPQRKCETCQKSFSSDLTLRLHLLTHKEVKQEDTGSQQAPMFGSGQAPGSGSGQIRKKEFSCDVCGRRFFTMAAQQAHTEKHDQQKASS